MFKKTGLLASAILLFLLAVPLAARADECSCGECGKRIAALEKRVAELERKIAALPPSPAAESSLWPRDTFNYLAIGNSLTRHGICKYWWNLVGMAASVCKKHDCDPRDVYRSHLDELKALMEKGVGDGRKHPRQDYNCQASLDPDIGKKHAESVEGRVK